MHAGLWPLSMLVALLLLADPAGAADACLSGASTLSDQRALLALRDAIEADAPCASYTGEPGLNRAAYRRRATAVRNLAIADGWLRPECKRLATRAYRTAVCGTTKIA